jgi:hypothetical protein
MHVPIKTVKAYETLNTSADEGLDPRELAADILSTRR